MSTRFPPLSPPGLADGLDTHDLKARADADVNGLLE